MKLIQLKYFCVVCQSNNLSEASEKLFVSQPTLSLAIKELESEFGIKLFLRNNNRLMLTEEGAFLFENASELIDQADNLARKMFEFQQKEFRVRCGMPPVMAGFFVPKLRSLNDCLKHEVPNVYIEFTEHSLKEVTENLADGFLDLAICTVEKNSHKQFGQQVLYKSPMKLCVGKTHRLAALKTAHIDDFKDEPMLSSHKSNSIATKLITDWFFKYGYTPNFKYYFSQIRTMESLLMSNMAITLARPEFQILDSNIVCIPLEDPIDVIISLLWNNTRPLRSEVVTVINLLKGYDFGSFA